MFVATVSSEPIKLNCTFVQGVEYTCRLINIEVLDPNQAVIVSGDHLLGKTDNDVEAVQVLLSKTPFMMQDIFTTFPNTIDLSWVFSNLQSINIPDIIKLEKLTLTGNNISRIDNGMLNKQRELYYLSLIENQIDEIDKDAFVGLDKLRTLSLLKNFLIEIAPETFYPLTSLVYVDLEKNLLTRIDSDLFSKNRNLATIYLEFNHIREISPRILSNTLDNLRSINLKGNICVNRAFNLEDEMGRIIFNNVLHTCFKHFEGLEVSGKREINMEFQGPLAIFDEYGNIIARVSS